MTTQNLGDTKYLKRTTALMINLSCIICERLVTGKGEGYMALPKGDYVCWPCLDNAKAYDGPRTIVIDNLKPIPMQTIILGDTDDAQRLFGDGTHMAYIEVGQ